MKKGRYVFVLFLIFFVLILATGFSFLFLEIGRPPSIAPSSYLEIKLEGQIVEFPETNFWISLLRGVPLSVHDVWAGFRKAKVDRRITGVLLRLGFLQCDWAKCSEIRDAVLDFRKSGKKVYAYIEEEPQFDKEYYLATACDRIILHPLGWLGIPGLGGYVPFFRKALDKLGIRAQFEHVEQYKTAYNMFTESGFTPAHREMMESILGDEFETYVKTVAEARKKSEAEVRSLIDEAFFENNRAVEAGLVDDLLYDDQVVALFQRDGRKSSRVGLDDYSRIDPRTLGLERGRKVALVYGLGPITGGASTSLSMGSETIVRWIRSAREDKSIAAVVFRVDSPGGSAVASDSIWREVVLCRKEKPLVVSMSDVAGSGGYWISMAASKIVAQPQTLTGSIGVIAGKFSFEGLFEKLGITAEKLAYGKRAAVFSPFEAATPEELQLLKKEILWIYDEFLAKVADGRAISKEDVDKIGKGRVWTGNQARDLHLVDELGGLSRAVEVAKDLAGIPRDEDVRLIVWPRRVSLLGSLFGRRESRAAEPLAPQFQKALEWATLLNEEKALAVMPLVLNFTGAAVN